MSWGMMVVVAVCFKGAVVDEERERKRERERERENKGMYGDQLSVEQAASMVESKEPRLYCTGSNHGYT